MLNKAEEVSARIERIFNSVSFDGKVKFVGLLSMLLAASLMIATNPDNIGPVGVTIVLFLFYIIITTIIIFFKNRRPEKYSTAALRKKMVARSCILAFPFVLLIALNTIHQLRLADLIVVPTLYFVASFYINKQFNL